MIFTLLFSFRVSLDAGEISIEEIRAALAPYYEVSNDDENPYYYTIAPTNNFICNNIGDWVVIETNTLIQKYTLISIEKNNIYAYNEWAVEVLERKPEQEQEKSQQPAESLFSSSSAKPYVRPQYYEIPGTPYGNVPNFINLQYPIPFRLEEKVIHGKKVRLLAMDEPGFSSIVTRYFSYDITTPEQQTELITRDYFGNEIGRYQKVLDFYTRCLKNNNKRK